MLKKIKNHDEHQHKMLRALIKKCAKSKDKYLFLKSEKKRKKNFKLKFLRQTSLLPVCNNIKKDSVFLLHETIDQ